MYFRLNNRVIRVILILQPVTCPILLHAVFVRVQNPHSNLKGFKQINKRLLSDLS